MPKQLKIMLNIDEVIYFEKVNYLVSTQAVTIS